MLRKNVEAYESLKLDIKKCNKCELQHRIFYLGTGPITATIMCIGQAPSIYRKTTEHFSQKSKVVFQKFLDAMNLNRDEVWITNVIKCVEPTKRTGFSIKCGSFIKREIKAVDPDEIFVFGKVATVAIFGKSMPYSSFKNNEIVCHVLPHPMTAVYDEDSGREKYLKEIQRVEEYRKLHKVKSRKQLTLTGMI